MKKLTITALLIVSMTFPVNAQIKQMFINVGGTHSTGKVIPYLQSNEIEIQDSSPSVGVGYRFNKYFSASFQYNHHEYEYDTIEYGSGTKRLRNISSVMGQVSFYPIILFNRIEPFVIAAGGVGKDIPRVRQESDLDNPLFSAGGGVNLRVLHFLSLQTKATFFRVAGNPRRDFQRIYVGLQIHIPKMGR